MRSRTPRLRALAWWLKTAAIVGILAVLFRLGVLHVLLLIFAGVMLGVVLRGAGEWVRNKTGMSDGWSLTLVMGVLLGALVGLIWLGAPRLIQQVNELFRRLPESVDGLQKHIEQYPWARSLISGESVKDNLLGAEPNLLRRLTGAAGKTFGMVVNLIIVVVIGIYLAAEPRDNMEGVLALAPDPERRRLRSVMFEIAQTLRLWMLGQIVPMVVIGCFVTIGLWALKVPLALTLGLLAALFNFIPNFGPLISLIPAALLALADSPEKALWVVALMLAAQSLEGYVITPLVQKRMVLLPPTLTISAQVVMGVLFGALGVALAAPLTAVALVVVKMLYVQDVLGEETELPSEQAEQRADEKKK